MTFSITNYKLLITSLKQYRYTLYVLLIPYIISCSTIDLPTVEESNKVIMLSKDKLEEAEKMINSKSAELPHGYNVDIKVQKDMINRVLSSVANDRKQDITINFLKTKNLIKDDKNVLGIEYTNFIDVDKGKVDMDLKTFKVNKMENNKVEATIEIEGNGDISLSGKNTGISASVTSGVDLYLKDNVEFKIESKENGNILLKPVPKKLRLKTKFSIAILKWNLPWREEIELEFADILSPIPVPMTLATEVDLPFPAKNKNPGQFDFLPFKVDFTEVQIKTIDDNLIWKSNANIMNKK